MKAQFPQEAGLFYLVLENPEAIVWNLPTELSIHPHYKSSQTP
jgi:hypothetical protein